MIDPEYDSTLIEQAVFLAARRDVRLESEIHAAIDPLYGIEDRQRREQAFRRVFRDWFRRFGLDHAVCQVIAERPLIGEHVGRCIVRAAPRAKAQSAELFVRGETSEVGPPERTLVIQLCPDSLVEPARVRLLLRRELLHVADMLDPAFEYQHATMEGRSPAQNLIRDRYRVLWDVYVEGRLVREGRASRDHVSELRANLERVFGTHEGGRDSARFDHVFDADRLIHGQLVSWAREPRTFLGARRTVKTRTAPAKPLPSSDSGTTRRTG